MKREKIIAEICGSVCFVDVCFGVCWTTQFSQILYADLLCDELVLTFEYNFMDAMIRNLYDFTNELAVDLWNGNTILTDARANGCDYDFRNSRDERHRENEMTIMTWSVVVCVQRIRLFTVWRFCWCCQLCSDDAGFVFVYVFMTTKSVGIFSPRFSEAFAVGVKDSENIGKWFSLVKMNENPSFK